MAYPKVLCIAKQDLPLNTTSSGSSLFDYAKALPSGGAFVVKIKL